MKITVTSLLIVLMALYSSQFCFAQDETVTADRLAVSDIEQALLSGTIASNCGMQGFPEYGATSLNPDTVIIKGIRQNTNEATIHFMGRFKESVMADERPVVCEAFLQRLASGEWIDPNGAVLKK